MDEYEKDWIREVKDTSEKLSSSVSKRWIDGMLQVYVLEEDGNKREEIKSDIDSALGLYEPRLLFAEKPQFSSPLEELNGEICLGTVWQADQPVGPFSLPKRALCRHMLIAGQSGHGKTRLDYRLVDSLITQGVSVIMFDAKLDGRPLIRRFPDLVALPPKFPVNFLRPPPGMKIMDWWNNLAQISAYTWGIFVASLNYLQEHLDKLCRQYESSGQLPTIHDLYDSVHCAVETSYRRAEYKAAVENKLYGVCSVFQNAMDVEIGIPLEKIFEHRAGCVVELQGLRPIDQSWITEVMLSWLFFYQMYQGRRGEDLQFLVICDEAHRIWDENKSFKEAAHELGDPTINLLPQQARDLGIGFVWSTQQPSALLKSCLANCLVKITGQLSNAQDIEFMSEVMGLTDEQKDEIHKLKRGQWLVRISDYYTKGPFYIETEDYPVERVTDQEVEARLDSVFGACFQKEEPKQEESEPKLTLPQLSKNAWALLIDINNHPFRGSIEGHSTRYKALNLSGRSASSVREELIEKGLVKEIEVKFGHRPTKFFVLTNLAIDMLRNVGQDVRLWRHTGHMGFEHQLYTVIIAYTFKKAGCQTFIEKDIGGERRVDVLTFVHEKKIAIEVETGNIDLQQKIKLPSDVDKLIIVAKDENALQLARSSLKEIPGSEKIELHSVIDYLLSLKSNYSSKTSGNKYIKRNKTDLVRNSGNKDGKKENQ